VFRVSLDPLSYSPRYPGLLDVRTHQSQISWFGKAMPNARAEIGDDGVEIGQVCEVKWSDDQSPALRR
jgi:hypothetical protein